MLPPFSCFRPTPLTLAVLGCLAQGVTPAVAQTAQNMEARAFRLAAQSYRTEEYNRQYGLEMINAAEAYALGYTGLGVTVGVVDTGIDVLHPAFRDAINSTSYWLDPAGSNRDPDGHGTHVSGIIAARRDGEYMHGVAFDSKLSVARVADDDGWFRQELINESIPKMINEGNVRIINNSYGIRISILDVTPSFIDPSFIEAVKFTAEKKVLMVWATGNAYDYQPGVLAGLPYYFPELKNNWLAVTSVGQDGTIPWYPNYCGVAKEWCLAAPGGSDDPATDGIWSSVPLWRLLENPHERWNGTSMAAPHVSGAAALVQQAFPYMDAHGLQQTLLTTATDLGDPGVDEYYGWGLLNVGKAVRGPAQFVSNWNINTQGYDSNWSNNISGVGGLTKRGEGVLLLSGKNTYQGNTRILGGTLAINNRKGLGASNRPVLINGGTLAFEKSFKFNRRITLGAKNGAISVGDENSTRLSGVISGAGALFKLGNGELSLTGKNTYAGGTAIQGGVLKIFEDANLGAAGTPVLADGGTLAFGAAFTLNRPFLVRSGGLTMSSDQELTLTGTDETSTGTLNKLGEGILRLSNRNTFGQFNLQEGSLQVDGILNAPLLVSSGTHLRGTGYIMGPTTVNGNLWPGNSPGVLTFAAPLTLSASSSSTMEIDGPSAGTGSGFHSAALVIGAGNTLTVNGNLIPLLRGLGAPASNTYTPALGQGFTILQADGGISGAFNTLSQPTTGLLPGSRFDVVYDSNTVNLYATPAAYANLKPLGISMNDNQAGLGSALDILRPSAGERATGDRKALFDGLAPLAAATLARTYDQLAGVAVADNLYGVLDNTRDLNARLRDLMGTERQGLRNSRQLFSAQLNNNGANIDVPATTATAENNSSSTGLSGWVHAFHGRADKESDGNSRGLDARFSGGLMGVERRFSAEWISGVALGYSNRDIDLQQKMGHGTVESWQLSAYSSGTLGDWRVDALAGLGTSRVSGSRSLSLANRSYRFAMDTRAKTLSTNLNISHPLSAWLLASLGADYSRMNFKSFDETGGLAAARLRVAGDSWENLGISAGLNAAMPLSMGKVTWLASGQVRVRQELADQRGHFHGELGGVGIVTKGGASGRLGVDFGIGLSGQIGKQLSLYLDLGHGQTKHGKSTSFSAGLKAAW